MDYDGSTNKPHLHEIKDLRKKISELKLLESQHEKADRALMESEEKYRSLIDNINIGIYRNTGGPRGRFLQANPAIARMFGYDSVEEFMKVPFSGLYQNPEENKLFIDEAIRNGFLKDKVIRLRKKDGTQIIGSCTAKVQYNKDGSVKWIDGVIEDVTERKLADERIEKSRYYEHTISSILKIAIEPLPLEEQLDRILDLILAIPFLSLQTKGCIYLAEDDDGVLVMKAHRGYEKEEIDDCSRVPFGKSLCGQAAATGRIVFSGSIAGGAEQQVCRAAHGEYCVPICSGDRVYGIISIVLKEGHIRDEQEEKFLASVADTLAGIIEHRNTELEKDKLQQQLIQSEKLSALGRMTANVAHEIRNPLTVLGGLAKRLGKTLSGGSREKEYADIIVSEATRLEKILRGVLSFTREERIQKENCDINEIIDESLRIIDVLYREKSIRVERSSAETGPVPVDKDQVREVLDNLLSNAAEAIQDGGTITIATGKEFVQGKPYYSVKVSDTGKGMSRDELDRIFEPFFTTKAVGTGGGIGLGLAICRKIMDEHGGFIKVDSVPGKGSEFTLFFPEQL